MKRSSGMPGTESLPPPDVRLISNRQTIPTPLNQWGLVDIKQLIVDVKSTVDSSYQWPTSNLNSHHLYWPKKTFGEKQRRTTHPDAPKLFRELHTNQALMPITFHNWMHRISEPPPIPDQEVMLHTIDAWNVTTRLFQSIYSSTQWQRVARRQEQIIAEVAAGAMMPANEKIIDDDIIEEILATNIEKVAMNREQMRRIPAEFQLVDPDKPLFRIAKEVGRLAAPDGLIFKRAVAVPLAA